jgi:FKBP-type peptidyl-prolyl cis-trans isomerase (trigger factor)
MQIKESIMYYTILTDTQTPFERKLAIKVESESIEDIWKEELTRLRGEIEVDGFRLGKAPLRMVEGKVGREAIWERVRELVSHRVVEDIVRQSDKKPLTSPKYDFDEIDTEKGSPVIEVWKLGKTFEFSVTYFLPPPSPEEIERDLLRGAGREAPTSETPGIETPQPPSVIPPDPRTEIPGSGIIDDSK